MLLFINLFTVQVFFKLYCFEHFTSGHFMFLIELAVLSPKECELLLMNTILILKVCFLTQENRLVYIVPVQLVGGPRLDHPVILAFKGGGRLSGIQGHLLLREFKLGLDYMMNRT